MATVEQILDLIQEKAPFQWQMGFDNSGFLVGRKGASVSRVLVALDITLEVAQEAADWGAELIVAHHPVIWGGAKSITDESTTGRVVLELIEHGVAAICAHTNLDMARGGVNDALARALGLKNLALLAQEGRDERGELYGIGLVGEVVPQKVEQFACFVKEALSAQSVRVAEGGAEVHRVAVGGGACGSMLSDVIAKGCDTFVTSDVKYDVFLEAKARHINLIDAGHYPTENLVCPVLAQWIGEAFPALEVEVSKQHREVYRCL